MIIGFFKNNNPASFIILPLFAIVLWLVPFIYPSSFVPQQIMPLYGFIALPILKWSLLSSIIALILIIAGAFLLNYIGNENEIFAKQSFLPALFYIALMSMNNTMQVLHPAIFSNLFLLLAINILLSAYRKDSDSAFPNALNAGALISISTLFYFPTIFYFPLIGFALIVLRPFNWREWVISFLGALLPFIFLLSYYFLDDKLIPFFINIQSFFQFAAPSHTPFLFYHYLPVIIGGIMFLLSFSSISHSLSFNSKKSKKGIIILFWFVFFSLVSFILAPERSIAYLSALAIPFAVFYTDYFLTVKKTKWAEFLFILFIASILFQQMYNFL